MVQQQMTLNIISEIKKRKRQGENNLDNEKLHLTCRKAKKTIVPLKWISLFFLGILPIFSLPNWCIH